MTQQEVKEKMKTISKGLLSQLFDSDYTKSMDREVDRHSTLLSILHYQMMIDELKEERNNFYKDLPKSFKPTPLIEFIDIKIKQYETTIKQLQDE